MSPQLIFVIIYRFSIVFNKEIEKDLAAIKEMNEKIQALNEEKQKLYKRGIAKMEKMFAMAEDFQTFVNIILHIFTFFN